MQLTVAYQPRVVHAQAIAPAQQMAMGSAGQHPYSLMPAGADPWGILSQLDGVSIKQQIQWAEVLVGWDCPNKYLISDPASGRDLFIAAERNNGAIGMIGRQVFEGGFRPFSLDIAMLTGPGSAPQPFLRLERPFKCTCCCFARPQLHIYNAITNKLIATSVEPFACCHFRLHLLDDAGQERLKVDHHCCDCSILCWGCPCGCQETNFEVEDNGNVVGNIRRQFNAAQAVGMLTGINADSDQFAVDFRQVQNPEWKAALIALALFLDYNYFVKGGREARDESALGRIVGAVERGRNN